MRRWAVLGVLLIVLWSAISYADGQLTYQFERKWPVLPHPWHFLTTMAVATAPDGSVYVIDSDVVSTTRVQRFNADGALLGSWGSPGSGDSEFDFSNNPGIAVGPAGTVYIADTLNHRVQRFEATGAFLSTWGSEGAGPGQFRSPSGLAVSSNGTIYVADTGNDRVQRFDDAGVFLGTWGSSGSGDSEFADAGDVAVSLDGTVYVTDTYNHRVQYFDATGVFLGTWGTEGDGEGQFVSPGAVSIGPDGTVYVTDDYRVQRFDTDGAFLDMWGTRGKIDGRFNSITDIAVAGDGTVCVTDWAGRVQRFGPDGSFLETWSKGGSDEGRFSMPTGEAVGPDGTVYVADTNNHRIQRFAPTGAFLGAWGTEGTGEGQFSGPTDVAASVDGTIYVLDSSNPCVQRFTSTGTFLHKWGSHGTGNGQFLMPYTLAVGRFGGTVYVTDVGTETIQRFSATGTFLGKWGVAGMMSLPGGIALGLDGTVYVAVNGSNLIRRFTSTGTFLGAWSVARPIGVTVGPQGTVYVAESMSHRISWFSPTGTYLGSWGTEGHLDGHIRSPLGLAMDPQGAVYVADSGNNRIQKFKPVYLTERAKAIVVAGGGPYPGNSLWNATVGSTNYAYAALTSQAFTKETIYYLSADTDLDLDNNGVADDVDGDCTKANLQTALLTWAPDLLGGLPTGDVVLYLVDHGGPDTFRISETEVLTSAELAPWLDTLEAQIQGKLIVVVDACYCGSFVDDLSSPGRIVIASAAADEEAQFQGSVSFSDYFWTRVFAGDTVQDAFDVGVAGMASQTPLLDDNGNSTANDATDGAVASVTHIGTGTQNTFNAPVISAAVGDHTLTGTATTTLWADATDTDGVASVWAVIQPPDAESATSYPSEPLWPATGARWENTVDCFTTKGTYTVLLYARDRVGSTSAPTVVEVTVGTPLRRKALVVAGISDPASARWPGIEYAADQAYRALKGQSYGDDDISYYSASGTVGVDGLATWNNVHYAIETWAATQTHDLVVYLVGEGVPGAFVLNATEEVTSTELDGWLDTLQATLPGGVVVLADIDCAGGFLPDLTPPVDKDRIVMATTGAAAPMHML
ncbi:MAG: hypothetical protein GY851_20475, partial [bacterium]|nr:hypothetical protein [bacterium]